jgi:hypothetical protein
VRAFAVLLPAWRRPQVPVSDTITLLGPNDEVVRITCDGHDTVVTSGPRQPTDLTVPEPPAAALFGHFGRRPAAGPLAEVVSRFGPF